MNLLILAGHKAYWTFIGHKQAKYIRIKNKIKHCFNFHVISFRVVLEREISSKKIKQTPFYHFIADGGGGEWEEVPQSSCRVERWFVMIELWIQQIKKIINVMNLKDCCFKMSIKK